MKWKTKITELLNIGYPVIQAPMFGVTTPKMVAGAIEAGCLGSLALGDLNASKCVEAIRATKQLTGGPFAVNIFVYDIPEIDERLKENYSQTKIFIEELARQNDIDVILPELGEININSYQEQVDAIIEEDCKVVSFTFGNPDRVSIEKLKNNNTLLIGTCTSVKEAIILEQSGIDIICVQGIEAGGHRGSFVTENIPAIGGLSLLPQVYDQVQTPLVYAGGLYNARTMLAAQALGAQGFQVGSLLLGSTESALKPFEKQRLKTLQGKDIVLTKSFSGRYARGIRNTFIDTIEGTDHILPYPYQNKLTSELRKAAKENNNAAFVSIWAGQSVNEYSQLPTREILKKLISETGLADASTLFQ